MQQRQHAFRRSRGNRLNVCVHQNNNNNKKNVQEVISSRSQRPDVFYRHVNATSAASIKMLTEFYWSGAQAVATYRGDDV